MHSVDLLPPEYWFYRVYSELTLSMLHQVNNELTGATFLSELIQEDLATGEPLGEKPNDLNSSIEKVIQLTKQIMYVHLPASQELEESPRDLYELLQEGLPMLRLVLPRVIAISLDPPIDFFPHVSIVPKEFHLILAAVGMLLSPRSMCSGRKLVITAESKPPVLTFYPDYPADDWMAGNAAELESSTAFLALTHRLKRLGGSAGVYRNPDDSDRCGLRLFFSSEPP